jgi:hypothetical protein
MGWVSFSEDIVERGGGPKGRKAMAGVSGRDKIADLRNEAGPAFLRPWLWGPSGFSRKQGAEPSAGPAPSRAVPRYVICTVFEEGRRLTARLVHRPDGTYACPEHSEPPMTSQSAAVAHVRQAHQEPRCVYCSKLVDSRAMRRHLRTVHHLADASHILGTERSHPKSGKRGKRER